MLKGAKALHTDDISGTVLINKIAALLIPDKNL
jgi:hypothetical protein